MSDLLWLANELVEYTKNYSLRDWFGVRDPSYANDVITVIEGYQNLIRRMAEMLEVCSGYGHGQWSQKIDELINEASGAIPEEKQ